MDQYDELKKLSQEKGPGFAWNFVKEAYTTESGSSLGGRAHDLAHYVGYLTFENQGLRGLPTCDTTFAFGCYHGFTERAFKDSLSQMQTVADACGSLGAVGSGPWASCIHGIGHGVATYFDSIEISDALEACDTLSEGDHYCHDGVFMEFAISSPSTFYNVQTPLAPCENLDERYLVGCARNQPSVLMSRFNLKLGEVIEICTKSSNILFKNTCIDALGLGIGNQSGGNHEEVIKLCGSITNPELHARCVSAAAGEFVFQNFPDWRQKAFLLCNSLEPQFQDKCHSKVEQTATNYHRIN